LTSISRSSWSPSHVPVDVHHTFQFTSITRSSSRPSTFIFQLTSITRFCWRISLHVSCPFAVADTASEVVPDNVRRSSLHVSCPFAVADTALEFVPDNIRRSSLHVSCPFAVADTVTDVVPDNDRHSSLHVSCPFAVADTVSEVVPDNVRRSYSSWRLSHVPVDVLYTFLLTFFTRSTFISSRQLPVRCCGHCYRRRSLQRSTFISSRQLPVCCCWHCYRRRSWQRSTFIFPRQLLVCCCWHCFRSRSWHRFRSRSWHHSMFISSTSAARLLLLTLFQKSFMTLFDAHLFTSAARLLLLTLFQTFVSDNVRRSYWHHHTFLLTFFTRSCLRSSHVRCSSLHVSFRQ